MPISSFDPVPRMSRKWRSRSVALRGTKLPIVEPGKKPSRGKPVDRGGKVDVLGEVGLDRVDRKLGKLRIDAAPRCRADNRPKCRSGHKRAGAIASSSSGVLVELPDAEFDDRASVGTTSAAISGILASSSAVSVRVG